MSSMQGEKVQAVLLVCVPGLERTREGPNGTIPASSSAQK